jgi:hypothetical protein
MEKINGGTLYEHIEHRAKIGEPFSREEQKYILRSLLTVVMYVHGKFQFFFCFGFFWLYVTLLFKHCLMCFVTSKGQIFSVPVRKKMEHAPFDWVYYYALLCYISYLPFLGDVNITRYTGETQKTGKKLTSSYSMPSTILISVLN